MTSNEKQDGKEKKFVVLASFLNQEEQRHLVHEAFQCHVRHQPPSSSDSASETWAGVSSSTSSFPLKLGIGCGGDLSQTMPFAVDLARRAFSCLPSLQEFQTLTGLALLYGPHAKMTPHYDSPTQPLQREEWLVMMTVGSSVRFRCNDELLLLHSGDALIMDSMAVLHGVEEIVVPDPDASQTFFGLPVSGSRLGVLLWRGSSPKDKSAETKSEAVELEEGTMAGLFGE